MGQRDILGEENLGSSLPRLHSIRKTRNESFRKRRRSVPGSFRRTYRMADGGVQQCGYIDIKQPPRVKGRKLKSWKKKWVVLQEMSIRSAGGRAAAKVDVYSDEKTATSAPADKHTFIFEYVTEVRAAKSKTHEHAFEVVESEAVLLMSGATELETQVWMSAFRQIFWPDQEECDSFFVEIVPNEHTRRLVLVGAFTLTVNPEALSIRSERHNSYEWSLHMLKRFHTEKDERNPEVDLLTIESGPKSECGEAVFKFSSENVSKILESIKRNIFIAINQKRSEEKSKSSTPPQKQIRASNSSPGRPERMRSDTCSSTEQKFRDLLENANLPSKPQSALMRVKSDSSEQSMDSEVVDEITGEPKELTKKKRASVTFDKSVVSESKVQGDILSSPIEVVDKENDNDNSDYNRVEFNTPTKPNVHGNIISTFTIAKPGYETRVLLDESGYSHVDMSSNRPVVMDDDKRRSLSNISSHSSMSCRSASVGSRDSGVPFSTGDRNNTESDKGRKSNRSTNSFDSAVSTSSAMDNTESTTTISNNMKLTVEIEAVEVTREELDASTNTLLDTEPEEDIEQHDDNAIYQDVSMHIHEDNDDDGGYKMIDKQAIKKSWSASNVRKQENEYEDLNEFRRGKKNLVKHLGMDPTVDPSSVPPSLPERPSSQRMRRKSYKPEKKLFTLPFRLKRDKKMRDRASSLSSSSSGGSENDDAKKNAELSLKVWPLGNKSMTAANEDLYQPIAIARFLKDNEGVVAPQKRERSCSLNLNTGIEQPKRPSISSTREFSDLEKKNAIWAHNRNASMQIDHLNRARDPNNTMFNVTNTHDSDTSLMPELLCGADARNSITVIEDQLMDGSVADNEPIYAEVAPAGAPSGVHDDNNPFPNLTLWQPQDISDVAEVSELNATIYENDESLNDSKRGDVFNQGFVDTDEGKDSNKISSRRNSDILLVDISENDSCNQCNKSVDLFTMGTGPGFIGITPLVPTRNSVHVSSASNSLDMSDIFNMGDSNPLMETNAVKETAGMAASSGVQEDIYMDMTTCRNESIYVMPSEIKSNSS
ncbi:hypothetical protein MAR_027204 [Mya arenaria]|uniref:PH domain-containing protein n=1 Tax=Mya arenaria TaxID=6604 RepID=A0ABY7EX71_MYAAR|nr:uncharacterized protein LOC128242607 [Mya arenaria]WAR13024.1 hypothetical protein MAR_027204 [Mya arenaria]